MGGEGMNCDKSNPFDELPDCPMCGLGAKVIHLEDEIKHLKEVNQEYETLFELQRRRMLEATKLWQNETGRHNTYPDLGDLLQWLSARRHFK